MKHLDSRARVHLEWMFENQPQLVQQLHKSSKLLPHLEKKEAQALRLVDRLKAERGMDEDEAFQVAMESVLAPADGPAMGDNPPAPLPLHEQARVWKALDPS